MANNPNIPFLRGQNVTLKLYQQGVPVFIAAKNLDVSPNVTECNDGVNGELRDRLDLVTNFFEGSVDVYQADEELITALMAAQDANDAQGIPNKQTAAVTKAYRNGTKVAYLMQDAVFGPWKESSGGRAENMMINLKFRFRNFKQFQAF